MLSIIQTGFPEALTIPDRVRALLLFDLLALI
jgi:hypothetical protein